jgi:hypothetical protein
MCERALLSTCPINGEHKECSRMIFDNRKECQGLASLIYAAFTAVVGLLFTLMLLSGTPVNETDV